VTVTVALPDCPSLLTEIVVEPTLSAVARPVAETEAMFAFAEDQAMERPARTLPPASYAKAANCVVLPTGRLVADGETVTEATGIGGGANTVRVP